MAQLSAEDAQAFREDLGLKEPGLDRVIRTSYALLGLISFLTAGEDECRAWTIRARHAGPAGRGRDPLRHRARLHPRRGRGLRRPHRRRDRWPPAASKAHAAARGQGVRGAGRRRHQLPLQRLMAVRRHLPALRAAGGRRPSRAACTAARRCPRRRWRRRRPRARPSKRTGRAAARARRPRRRGRAAATRVLLVLGPASAPTPPRSRAPSASRAFEAEQRRAARRPAAPSHRCRAAEAAERGGAPRGRRGSRCCAIAEGEARRAEPAPGHAAAPRASGALAAAHGDGGPLRLAAADLL